MVFRHDSGMKGTFGILGFSLLFYNVDFLCESLEVIGGVFDIPVQGLALQGEGSSNGIPEGSVDIVMELPDLDGPAIDVMSDLGPVRWFCLEC